MTDITIRWNAKTGALSTTDYKIYSDVSASGTFVLLTTRDATNRGDGGYGPYTTTLSTAIGAGSPGGTLSMTFADATNFANNEFVVIDREFFKLGGKSGSTFATCTPGLGGSLKRAHAAGATVTKAHESYALTGITFGSRHVIRYRISALDSGIESPVSEGLAIYPTPLTPTGLYTADYAIMYGILDNFGVPKSGVTVQLTINDADNFHPGTGELIYKRTYTTTSDNDGYWEIPVHRDISREGGDLYTLVIDPGGSGEESYTIRSIPDIESVHYLECL
jgi:hypothetical protein